jgi:ribonuclease VapC
MIVDPSALIAIVRREQDADHLEAVLYGESHTRRISAPSYFEACIVLDSARDPVTSGLFDQLVTKANIEIVDFTAEQAQIARRAYRDFGKGSGHRAQLNFGDCFTYALATVTREAVLCKGDDFVHTDLRIA